MYLKVLKDDIHETQRSRKSAERVLNLLYKGKHWVLVSLLLANVIVNESLPVVLDRVLGGGISAIIGATILIGRYPPLRPSSRARPSFSEPVFQVSLHANPPSFLFT